VKDIAYRLFQGLVRLFLSLFDRRGITPRLMQVL
jgi:hypothetical protein